MKKKCCCGSSRRRALHTHAHARALVCVRTGRQKIIISRAPQQSPERECQSDSTPMEFNAPFPATPPAHRRAAVQAYIDGEALCDKGETKAGIALIRQATFVAWELDSSDWPAWAEQLYGELVDGTPPPPPPPLLEHSDGEAYRLFIPTRLTVNSGSSCHDGEQWWTRPDALDAICSTLARQHFVVLDAFAGSVIAQGFRDACEAEWRTGRRFRPAKVAEPGGGTDGARSVLTRSDHITWVDVRGQADDGEPNGGDADANEEGQTREFHTGLRSIVERVDALIRLLQPRLLQEEEEGESRGEGGSAIVTRQRPQVARYGEGDAFARHCDNYCPAAGHGPYCNQRWLTCVYYASSRDWRREADGGCLRVFRPQGGEDDAVDTAQTYEEDAVVDVAPLADRLLLFRSDFRVPHAVLPVTSAKARYAVTCWINRRRE